MKIKTKVRVEMKNINTIIKDKGLDAGGAVQAFHTQNVLRRVIKYVPLRSSSQIKRTINATDIRKPLIHAPGPYAKYLYYGVAMKGKAPKKATDKPLNYDTTKNPLAGPFWDRRLKAAEGEVLRRELQAFINRR